MSDERSNVSGDDGSSKATLGQHGREVLADYLAELSPSERMKFDILEYLVVETAGCSIGMVPFLMGLKLDTPNKITRGCSMKHFLEWKQGGLLPSGIPWVDFEQLNGLAQALNVYKFETLKDGLGPRNLEDMSLHHWMGEFDLADIEAWYLAEWEMEKEVALNAKKAALIDMEKAKIQAEFQEREAFLKEYTTQQGLKPEPEDSRGQKKEKADEQPESSGAKEPEGDVTPGTPQKKSGTSKMPNIGTPNTHGTLGSKPKVEALGGQIKSDSKFVLSSGFMWKMQEFPKLKCVKNSLFMLVHGFLLVF